jgi:hypothetical protein
MLLASATRGCWLLRGRIHCGAPLHPVSSGQASVTVIGRVEGRRASVNGPRVVLWA